MTSWDKLFQSAIKQVSKQPLVLDIGGSQPFNKQLKDYKHLFNQSSYFTLDITSEYKPNMVADAHSLPIKSSSIPAVICKAVLEHVYNPHLVVEEIFRVCKPEAKIFVYAPFLYHYHGDRNYNDYYRFTHDGLKHLFRNFSHVSLSPVRGYAETLTNLFPAPIPNLIAPLSRFSDSFLPKTKQVSGYNLFARK